MEILGLIGSRTIGIDPPLFWVLVDKGDPRSATPFLVAENGIPAKDGAMVTMMTDELKIAMLASSAASGLARTLLAARLHKWGYSHISDDALLVTAELVTNAAEAAPRQQIKLRASRDAAGVVIGVWDPSNNLPRARQITELTLDTLDLSEESWDNNGGWGLPIVQALATDCGYNLDPAGGKWTWARLKVGEDDEP